MWAPKAWPTAWTPCFRAAARLRERTDIVFLLVGDGAEAAALRRQRDALGLTNVCMEGQQPKETMPGIWALTDVSLVLLRKHPAFESVIPSKIFEAMGMERPIILGVRGESQRIVDAAGAGLCIEPENDEALAAAVLALANRPVEGQSLGAAGRRYVAAHYDRKKLATRYVHLMARTAETRRVF